MRIYEYMGKDLFRAYGIPVPTGVVISSPDTAALAQVAPPAVLKAQVLSGKRGKGGGILFVDEAGAVQSAAKRLFATPINGYRTAKVLVEERLAIAQELYLALTVDRALQAPVLLASAQGGMDIEEVPASAVLTRPLEVALGVPAYVVREVAAFLGLAPQLHPSFATLLGSLYRLFREKDAELVEINPLAVTAAGQLVAADAKVVIDDDALFRHPELPRVEEITEAEAKARRHDLAYVELDGNIGVLANGAGITMATLDTLQYYGGRARNFLDIGGGAGVERVTAALEIILASRPKALFINIFGGITRCDDVATALVEVKKRCGLPVPVVIRMVGTNEEEGVRILRLNGLEAYTRMEEAAKKVVELAENAA